MIDGMNERRDAAGLWERVRAALEDHPEVTFAYLFGSRSRGRAHPRSDVDVAVYVDPSVAGEAGSGAGDRLSTWSDLHARLVRALAPVLGRGDRGGAPEGVDLLLLNDAPPLLSERVVRHGELLFSRSEPERVRWVARTKSRYCDLRPLRRRLDRALAERLESGRFGRPAAAPGGTGEPELGEGAD